MNPTKRSVPIRSHWPFPLGLGIVLLALALSFAATAAADSSIGLSGSTLERIGPGGLVQPLGIAVSAKEGGDVYASDGDPNERVSEFDPSRPAGEDFVRAFGWGIVQGAVQGTGDLREGSTAITNVTTTLGAFATGYFGAGKTISGPGIQPGTRIAAVTATEIELSQPATESGEGVPLSVAAGPGNKPTNELQELTVRAGSGSYELTFKSPKPGSVTETTAPIPYNASAAALQEALEALPAIGAGNVTASGGGGDPLGDHPYLIEFTGRYADTWVFPLQVSQAGLSGGTPSTGASVALAREGGGVVETCTTVCGVADGREDAEESGEGLGGSNPGQFNYADAVAIDNDSGSPSYGDVYVVDQRNFRVEKFGPEGEFLLMFGGDVNKTTGGAVCTAAQLAAGDVCGAGVPGTAPSHFFEAASKSWATEGNNSIAVGPSGTVYVGDYGRIQEFEPSGAFAGEFKLPDAEPQFVGALAVDPSGDVFERSATEYPYGTPRTQVAGVREFSPAHALLHTFDAEAGRDPQHIALDGHGDLFVSEGTTFRAFKPDTSLYAVFTSGLVNRAPAGIAIDPLSETLYATVGSLSTAHIAAIALPQPGPPSVSGEEVTSVEPKTATLQAVVNPEQLETTYRFQWVTQQHFEAEGFANAEESTPVETDSVSQDLHVETAISDLTPATSYRWRVLAENSAGATHPEAEFETLPNISVRDFTTQTVGPETVKFKAEINPNNGSGTTYSIKYGKNTEYLGGTAEGTVPLGDEFVPVTATFSGLEPNTTYHYELTAQNSNGPVATGDAIFTTELSQAEERSAKSCGNQLRREENGSLTLPDCRAYEQVSPVFKAASGVYFPGLSPSGEQASFRSIGIFGGAHSSKVFNPYVAERTPSGWRSESTFGEPEPGFIDTFQTEANAELNRWVILAQSGKTGEESQQQSTLEYAFYLGTAGTFSRATPVLSPLSGARKELGDPIIAQSSDLSHLFIGTNLRYLPDDPVGDVIGNITYHIYEIAGAGTANPTLRFVASIPPGLSNLPQEGSCELDARFVHGVVPNPSSADGSTLFYSAPLEVSPHTRCEGGEYSAEGSSPNKIALFARSGEAPPVQVSTPPPGECHSPSPCASAALGNAEFDGASPDGGLAWFTTPQPLVDSDRDHGKDLYLARLQNGQVSELVQVSAGEATASHPTAGEGAGVQGVLEVSPDGTHVAFVATGVLTETPNGNGESAAPGADNLYLYDASTNELKFVARLCSGPRASGHQSDASCDSSLDGGFGERVHNDSGLWDGGDPQPRLQLTPDGGFLLFDTYAGLAPGDTDGALDAYRYDFQTGSLIRVSAGHRGNDGNGNDPAFEADVASYSNQEQHLDDEAGDYSRNISSDGSVAIFTTAAPLVSRDTNEAPDVYEWEEDGHGTCTEPEGCVSLVSDGLAPHGSTRGVISASGEDIAFATPQSLTPADHDGLPDLYDARVEGGFPEPVPPPRCGAAESCHQGTTTPSPSPNPASQEFVGPPQPLRCAKGKVRIKKHGQVRCVSKRRHRKHKRKHRKSQSHRRAAK